MVCTCPVSISSITGHGSTCHSVRQRDRLCALAVGLLVAGASWLTGCSGSDARVNDDISRPVLPSSALDDIPDAPEPELQPVVHFQAGQMFESRADMARTHGNPDKAAQLYLSAAVEYRNAIGKNPQFIQAYDQLAKVYMRAQQWELADNTLKEAIRVDPSRKTLHNNLGYSYLMQRRYQDAEATLQNALNLDSNYTRARVNLGFAVGYQGRYDEAFHHFESAPMLTKADAHYNMGVLFEAWSDLPRAKEAYTNALAYNAQLSDARAALERLRSITERQRSSDATTATDVDAQRGVGIDLPSASAKTNADTPPPASVDAPRSDQLIKRITHLPPHQHTGSDLPTHGGKYEGSVNLTVPRESGSANSAGPGSQSRTATERDPDRLNEVTPAAPVAGKSAGQGASSPVTEPAASSEPSQPQDPSEAPARAAGPAFDHVEKAARSLDDPSTEDPASSTDEPLPAPTTGDDPQSRQ